MGVDQPPVDHGSDRGLYVEVTAPPGLRPIGTWWDELIAHPCPDCLANVFATWIPEVGNVWRPDSWKIEIAHDDSCPNPAAP